MIVVTGGAGFIGSAIVWRLNQQTTEAVTVVDRLAGEDDPKRRNLAPLKVADYLDADDFLPRARKGQFKGGVSALIHMGAISSTTETDEALLKRNNTDYTRTLAESSVSAGIRFIYASSAATYGDGSSGFSDNPDAMESLQPLNLYGASKHRFDLWAKGAGLLDRIVGLKYFNVFGPNEYHKGDMRSVVLKSFEQIRETGRVRLFKSHRPDYEDGKQMRDFLYIKDAVEMTLFFLESHAAGIFNIGSGKAHTWLDLVTPVFTAQNLDPRVLFIDMPEEIRDKYQYHTEADISRLRAAGYARPLTPLADAVSDYVLNYLVPGVCLKP
ncbi:ADP-glyceromanno-heptose 6-epimerase [bacterium]|nr:ADP-glyceromanno-heptose 6-epimerase [bacterium]